MLHLTADQTAKQWMAYIGDTTQLLVLHSLDPTVATPLLDAHMKRFGAWMVTLFFFNTKGAQGWGQLLQELLGTTTPGVAAAGWACDALRLSGLPWATPQGGCQGC